MKSFAKYIIFVSLRDIPSKVKMSNVKGHDSWRAPVIITSKMKIPDAKVFGTLTRKDVFKKETKMSILIDFIFALKAFVRALMISIWNFFVSPPKKSVTGEIVLITGSGSGIGRQLALEFGKLGAVLILWDIDEESNIETGNLLKKCDAQFHLYHCDVG